VTGVRCIIQQEEIAIHHRPNNIHSTTLLKDNGVETESIRNNEPLIEVGDTRCETHSSYFLYTPSMNSSRAHEKTRHNDLTHMEIKLRPYRMSREVQATSFPV
jgi:hypothetical protein